MKELEYNEEKAKDLLFQLKKDPILKDLTLLEIFELLEVSQIIQYDPMEYIIKQGEYDTRLLFLVSGEIEIVFNEKPICTLNNTGEIIGEMSLITKEVRSASVRAVNDVKCLILDTTVLENPIHTGRKNILFYILCHVLVNRLKNITKELSETKKKLAEMEAER